MRFDELNLRVPGDEVHLRFHPHLTVMSGIGMLERQALTDSVVGAMTGAADAARLTLVDATGRPIEAIASGGRVTLRYLDDGTPAPAPVGTLAADAESLRELMLVQAPDLGLAATRARPDDPPDLAEARATLAAVTQELEAAIERQERAHEVRARLARVEAQIDQIHSNADQREYAKVLAELERVRAEAAALQSGNVGIETDRHLLVSAPGARELAQHWREAATRLATIAQRFGSDSRLDKEALAAARLIPDEPPVDIESLLDALATAMHERDELDGRLRALAASRLPDPSDDRVVDLATIEQRELWAARTRLVEASKSLHRAQVSMGGVSGGGDAGAGVNNVLTDIETAHETVEDAEELHRRRFVPTVAGLAISAVLLILAALETPLMTAPALIVAGITIALGQLVPLAELQRARQSEKEALERAGAPTYLSFHMRRVDAVIDPHSRAMFEAAAADLRRAQEDWDAIAHGIDVESANRLESEIRAYAAALAGLGDTADEIESLRSELITRAEPAVVAARRSVARACAPYGLVEEELEAIDAPAISRRLRSQLILGKRARLQDELQDAEEAEEKLATRLDEMLNQLSFREGELDARVGALEWAVGRAAEREEARARARPRDVIEQDLERLQAEARRLRRPEWASVSAQDAEEPDLETLQREREALTVEITKHHGATDVDVDRLADRHAAMERRVAALESRLDGTSESAVSQLADVQQYLLAHLTQAAHVGPYDETVPVLLDEPFLRVGAERKWELLDMLRRLAEKTQLVYLTDDPFVTAWARRQAAAGEITLLEPVGEGA